MTTSNLLLTTEGFTLRPELAEMAAADSAKLLRRAHPRVHRVRLHLRHETPHHAAPSFVARATAEHAGPDHVVHASATEPGPAIHLVFTKLERELDDAAGVRRRARHAEPVIEEPIA